jgi:acetyl esterase/lipase
VLITVGACFVCHAATNLTDSTLKPPTFRDVHYGAHKRQVLDFWQASSNITTPLLVYIHAVGWRGGDKSFAPPRLAGFLLAHGVSVASINYRYSSIAPLPAPVLDAARAIQFIRWKAADWRLDKQHIAAAGSSAGACTTLWLAYHDDIANPKSEDPVERESSRVCAAVGVAGQTSIDPEVIAGWVGDEVLNHGMICGAVGAKSRSEMESRAAEYRELFREFSPINHVSSDDPPVFLLYSTPSPLPAPNPGTAIHHAQFGIKLKEKADAARVACVLRYADPPEEGSVESTEFLLKYLTKS